jgi:phosphoglycolate phosphatase
MKFVAQENLRPILKMILSIKSVVGRIKLYLSRLSFRTGVIILSSCVIFYALSFAALALPLSAGMRGFLWAALFGMAKTAQYGGLAVLGVEGVKRVKSWFNRDKKGA